MLVVVSTTPTLPVCSPVTKSLLRLVSTASQCGCTKAFSSLLIAASALARSGGDAAQGAHATFTRFVPGYDARMHTHTNDVWIVVIKGAYLYKDDAGEKRVGPGSFLRVPGGKKHWSGGDAREGALFYEESSGRFDLIPAK